jgi:hypothetical protein
VIILFPHPHYLPSTIIVIFNPGKVTIANEEAGKATIAYQ